MTPIRGWLLRASVVLGVAVGLSTMVHFSEAQEPAAAKNSSVDEAKPATNVGLATKEDLSRWSKPIDQIQVWAAPQGALPTDGATTLFVEKQQASATSRLWACSGVQWCPSELAYHPLYFDDVPLERYGQTPCPLFQPALSGAHFFGTVTLMPYKILIDHPCDCIWDYGYYRPGSPTPCIRQRLVP